MMMRRLLVPFLSFSLLLVLLCGISAQALQFAVPQQGYHTHGPKVAYLQDVPEGVIPKVYVYDANWTDSWEIRHGRTVYKIPPENVRVRRDMTRPGPGMYTWEVDFTGFETAGDFELRVDNSEVKQPVKVSNYIYWDMLKPVAKTFYFQRCGQDIEDVKKNYYHLACHKTDATLKSETDAGKEDTLDTAGGWHDGGDYAKHTTSTSVAVSKLLSMYELSPRAFKYFKLDYPYWEQGIGTVPDLLLETREALDWLLAMQQLNGGVYSKVAGTAWPDNNLAPDHDNSERYVYGITTQDTASAAAAFAVAARAYRQADLGYAVRNLLAAQRSWKYLENHPKTLRNDEADEANGSSDYVLRFTDSDDLPFRVWASAELYLSTGAEKYHRYFLDNYKKVPFQVSEGWRNPAMIGFMNYVRARSEDVAKDPAAQAYLKDNLLKLANRIVAESEKTPYGSGLSEFTHESNYKILERTGVLLTAYELTQDNRYRRTAAHAVDYLFGINPLQQTFITGLGSKPVNHPQHRMMAASKKLIEGYIVSGPDAKATDGRTPKGLGAASYKDDPQARSVNETGILYNASLAYVLGALNAAYNIEDTAPNAPPKSTKEKLDEMNREDSGREAVPADLQ